MSTEQLLEWMVYLLTLVGVILCGLIVWLVFSPVPFGLRWALERTGLTQLLRYRRLLGLRRLFRWPARAFDAVQKRLGAGQSEPSVRVVIDERLDHLDAVIRQNREAVEQACETIRHFGTGGPAALSADLDAMQKRAEEVADLGGDIKTDETLRQYEGRARSGVNLVFGLFFGLAFALGNGILLNQFSRELIPQYFAGVPVSVFFSVLLVVFEAGLGWLIAINSTPEKIQSSRLLRWFFIALVAIFAMVEATIFGLMSFNFEIDVPLMDDHPWMRYWLAPLGVVFASTTAGVGYAIHQLFDERATTSGALKLTRDIKAANAYVADLPKRWESIRERAREAKSALNSYASALGERDGKAGEDGATAEDGAIKGLVDRIARECKELVKALAAANPKDWKTVAEGAAGDDRRETVRGVGLFIVTLVVVAAMVASLVLVLPRAFGGLLSLPGPAWTTIAVIFTGALYMIGALPFGRLHNTDPVSGRTYPYRTEPVEKVLAGAVGLAAIVALMAAGVLAFGLPGIVAGLFLIVGAAGTTYLGYHFERAWRGAMVAGRVLASLAGWLLVAVIVTVANLACWLVAFVFWPIWALLKFLGLPLEAILDALARRRARLAAGTARSGAAT